jgi:hypothetical protein
MKSRLLACAAAGLACTFPGLAGAQVSVPLDQITAHVRASGLQPLSRPMLRGVVYYVRAINPARAEMRVAIDARSGRGHDYSEAPSAEPLENRAMPPGRIPDAPAKKRESASSPAPAKPVMVPIAPLE